MCERLVSQWVQELVHFDYHIQRSIQGYGVYSRTDLYNFQILPVQSGFLIPCVQNGDTGPMKKLYKGQEDGRLSSCRYL